VPHSRKETDSCEMTIRLVREAKQEALQKRLQADKKAESEKQLELLKLQS